MGNRIHRDNEAQELAVRYPENSGFAPNQPLIMQGPEEDQDSTPPMNPIQTIKGSSHLHAQSVKLIQDPSSNSTYFITFSFDTRVDCTINAYFLAAEHFLEEGKIQYNCKDQRNSLPMSFNFGPGINQLFPENFLKMDFQKYTQAELGFVDSRYFPLVLEIKPQNISSSESTLISFRQSSDGYSPKIIQQRVQFGDKLYELKEVYGSPTNRNGIDEENQLCSICLEHRRNTIVIPCCHMCLCVRCGNFLRTQINKKCPICRTEADSLVKVTFDERV
ncbi:unnamed protein product [Blepharisma stoltei]|uniref:RING-type E3 ubiquitin transferase n=1 Tax=Blepharisma stoltei TaxID=1481888 RepID=A0AAU9K590_9CILI|nr:unnamed protein product [Blepharisma stoltei]